MKIKYNAKGNVQITLTPEQAEHLKEILNVCDVRGEVAPKETKDTSWELWELLAHDELPN